MSVCLQRSTPQCRVCRALVYNSYEGFMSLLSSITVISSSRSVLLFICQYAAITIVSIYCMPSLCQLLNYVPCISCAWRNKYLLNECKIFHMSFKNQNNIMRLKLLFSCSWKTGLLRPYSEKIGELKFKHLSGWKSHTLPLNDPARRLPRVEFRGDFLDFFFFF